MEKNKATTSTVTLLTMPLCHDDDDDHSDHDFDDGGGGGIFAWQRDHQRVSIISSHYFNGVYYQRTLWWS